MSDLHLVLDRTRLMDLVRSSGRPRQTMLYEVLREAIAQGRLLAGAVLPASRELAQELGMGRNGVLHAYEQLAAEGYVQASRQGTVVAAWATLRASREARPAQGKRRPVSRRTQDCDRRRLPHEDLLPFMPGIPALDAFPLQPWQRLCDRALRQGQHADLGYRYAHGEPELRQAIATYLHVARGVRCHADQVTVTTGTQDSMALCAQILADPGDTVWIEHPGYGGARTAFKQAGLNLVPVTVDADGMAPSPSLWAQQPPRLIYTTPSHQYPLGSVLSLARRLDLIEQARRHGSWILEDDYDSEIRHEGAPLRAMQGQVEDAPVVYLGTFSKSMFPALRLGFVVWPADLADRAQGVVGELVRGGRPFEQRALAAFIDEGHFARHLRRMRRLYARRLAALQDALQRRWPLEGQILGAQAGMHIVLSVPGVEQGGVADQALSQAARQLGIWPRPLSSYGMGGIEGFNGLVMGYANTHEDRMHDAVASLVKALAVARTQR